MREWINGSTPLQQGTARSRKDELLARLTTQRDLRNTEGKKSDAGRAGRMVPCLRSTRRGQTALQGWKSRGCLDVVQGVCARACVVSVSALDGGYPSLWYCPNSQNQTLNT